MNKVARYDTLFVTARIYVREESTKVLVNYKEKWLPVEAPLQDGWEIVQVQPSKSVKERKDGDFYGIAMYQKEIT